MNSDWRCDDVIVMTFQLEIFRLFVVCFILSLWVCVCVVWGGNGGWKRKVREACKECVARSVRLVHLLPLVPSVTITITITVTVTVTVTIAVARAVVAVVAAFPRAVPVVSVASVVAAVLARVAVAPAVLVAVSRVRVCPCRQCSAVPLIISSLVLCSTGILCCCCCCC